MTTSRMDVWVLAAVAEKVESGELILLPMVLGSAYRKCRRFKEVLKRGWEPWNKPGGMHFGFIERVDMRERSIAKFAAMGALFFGLVAAVLSFLATGPDIGPLFNTLAYVGAALTAFSCVGIADLRRSCFFAAYSR